MRLPGFVGKLFSGSLKTGAAPAEQFDDYEGGNEHRESVAFRLLHKLLLDAAGQRDFSKNMDWQIIPAQQAALARLRSLCDAQSPDYQKKMQRLEEGAIPLHAAVFSDFADGRLGDFRLPEKHRRRLSRMGRINCSLEVYPFDDRSVIVSLAALDRRDLAVFENVLAEIAPQLEIFLRESREAVREIIAIVSEHNPMDAALRRQELEKTEWLNLSNFATLYQSFAANRFLFVSDMRDVLRGIADADRQAEMRQRFDGFLNRQAA